MRSTTENDPSSAATDGGIDLSEMQRRHGELRLVLDHVNQGFLTIGLDGVIQSERSAVLDEWIGPHEKGTLIWDYLAAAEPDVGVMFQIGWDALLEGELPQQLLLDQLPQRLRKKSRVLALRYRPILDEGTLTKVLVVLSDITAQVERERFEVERREMLTVFEKIVQNKAAFLDFFDEANDLVRILTSDRDRPSLTIIRRHLHTLKGAASLFGLLTVQDLCHTIESRMADAASDLLPPECAALVSRWRSLSSILVKLFGKGEADRIEIDSAEYSAVVSAIASGTPREQLMRMIVAWQLQPVQAKLDHLGAYAVNIAERLGKSRPRILIDSGGVRLSPERWSTFFTTLTHVVRNAVDHGFEDPEERQRAGKPEAPTLSLRATVQSGLFVIEIADDGRGINWIRLGEKAREKGMPANTRALLIEILFSDGITTKDEVSEYSGRGVGMSAVRDVCQALGGQIKVASMPERGTTFQFRFPLPEGASQGADGVAMVFPMQHVHPTMPPLPRPSPIP